MKTNDTIPGGDVNAGNKFDKTPLHMACAQGNSDCVKLPVEVEGANVDARNHMNQTVGMQIS